MGDQQRIQIADEPVRVPESQLIPASCLACRAEVLHWPGGSCCDGRALTLDAELVGPDVLLSLHDCHFEAGPDEIDDPDYGWVDLFL